MRFSAGGASDDRACTAGEHFLCGMSPPDDPDAEGDFAVEYGLFDELLWPAMAQRVPEFAALKLVRARTVRLCCQALHAWRNRACIVAR